jgi:thiamine-phosphate pyrophosphorylase
MEPIIISYPAYLKDECRIVNQLFEAGLQIFHLRKPGYSRLDCQHFLRGIDPLYHNRVSLHQYHELANEFNIDRLHYPEASRSKAEDHMCAAGKLRSTSIHRLDELMLLKHFDYTFFSPVFDSLSKPGYRSATDRNFRLDTTAVPTKVIALGGIEPANITRVQDMMFDGIALLGCIWNYPTGALAKFLKIQTLWQANDRLQ